MPTSTASKAEEAFSAPGVFRIEPLAMSSVVVELSTPLFASVGSLAPKPGGDFAIAPNPDDAV